MTPESDRAPSRRREPAHAHPYHLPGPPSPWPAAQPARGGATFSVCGLVSQAGAVLLWETIRVTGLGRGLSDGLARWRAPRAVHDPGKIVADRAAAVALGGDCLADIAVLREQPELAGPVASDPVVSRLVRDLAAQGPRALRAIRGCPGGARERAWALAGETPPERTAAWSRSTWTPPS